MEDCPVIQQIRGEIDKLRHATVILLAYGKVPTQRTE